MKPSELVWKYLEDNTRSTRGEAIELFEEAVGCLFEESGSGNGSIVDTFELALDELCKDKEKLYQFHLWFDELNENEDE